jgi:hypothetical protein
MTKLGDLEEHETIEDMLIMFYMTELSYLE